MTDVFSKNKRSWIMSRVKVVDTKPEIIVRSAVHRMGLRFRVHRRDIPGSPDIVLPRHAKVIFVHGCFWHGHRGCSRARRPTTNRRFWNKKLNSNIERDKRLKNQLRKMGWEMLVVWECETKQPERLLKKLQGFFYEK